MIWYQQVNERIQELHIGTVLDQATLSEQLAAVIIRLSNNGFDVSDEAQRLAVATTKTISDMVAEKPGRNIEIPNDRLRLRDQSVAAWTDPAVAIGDTALVEWVRFVAEVLAGSLDAAAYRAISFAKLHPQPAIIIYPTTLFRTNYREELIKVVDELTLAESRVKEFRAMNRTRSSRGQLTRVIRATYLVPTTAFESFLEVLDPEQKLKRTSREITIQQQWKNEFAKRMEKVDKDMQRKGLMPHSKYVDMERRYTEKTSRLTEQRNDILTTLQSECEEAINFLTSANRVSV